MSKMTHTSVQIVSRTPRPDAPVQPGSAPPGASTTFMDVRRRQTRFPVSGLAAHSPVFGRAVDASDGGLRLESAAPLIAGSRYVFRLNYGARFISLSGRLVWCRLDRWEPTAQGPRAIFQSGIEFAADRAAPAWRSALADRAGVALGA